MHSDRYSPVTAPFECNPLNGEHRRLDCTPPEMKLPLPLTHSNTQHAGRSDIFPVGVDTQPSWPHANCSSDSEREYADVGPHAHFVLFGNGHGGAREDPQSSLSGSCGGVVMSLDPAPLRHDVAGRSPPDPSMSCTGLYKGLAGCHGRNAVSLLCGLMEGGGGERERHSSDDDPPPPPSCSSPSAQAEAEAETEGQYGEGGERRISLTGRRAEEREGEMSWNTTERGAHGWSHSEELCSHGGEREREGGGERRCAPSVGEDGAADEQKQPHLSSPPPPSFSQGRFDTQNLPKCTPVPPVPSATACTLEDGKEDRNTEMFPEEARKAGDEDEGLVLSFSSPGHTSSSFSFHSSSSSYPCTQGPGQRDVSKSSTQKEKKGVGLGTETEMDGDVHGDPVPSLLFSGDCGGGKFNPPKRVGRNDESQVIMAGGEKDSTSKSSMFSFDCHSSSSSSSSSSLTTAAGLDSSTASAASVGKGKERTDSAGESAETLLGGDRGLQVDEDEGMDAEIENPPAVSSIEKDAPVSISRPSPPQTGTADATQSMPSPDFLAALLSESATTALQVCLESLSISSSSRSSPSDPFHIHGHDQHLPPALSFWRRTSLPFRGQQKPSAAKILQKARNPPPPPPAPPQTGFLKEERGKQKESRPLLVPVSSSSSSSSSLRFSSSSPSPQRVHKSSSSSSVSSSFPPPSSSSLSSITHMRDQRGREGKNYKTRPQQNSTKTHRKTLKTEAPKGLQSFPASSSSKTSTEKGKRGRIAKFSSAGREREKGGDPGQNLPDASRDPSGNPPILPIPSRTRKTQHNVRGAPPTDRLTEGDEIMGGYPDAGSATRTSSKRGERKRAAEGSPQLSQSLTPDTLSLSLSAPQAAASAARFLQAPPERSRRRRQRQEETQRIDVHGLSVMGESGTQVRDYEAGGKPQRFWGEGSAPPLSVPISRSDIRAGLRGSSRTFSYRDLAAGRVSVPQKRKW
uniref:Uncharacterized protein n=2 Tax=Chromera velia CCMP2878 TaxID=1169474 RepID=A0A0K6SA28_9ALVE|eukprot:Cvel_8457.t1-p1 / transcript=Cvel_8457.t1 / gene=Cvel_8457 / organism=Chromera_velia_CCMP2878 / gene_product=hypothetical protein / transcript_product=hypothetical protein / location=Cvel_scaffold467:40569-43472(+) / protein_length=968 / sequence_SO=supercontig / SO=protein_coding / is_pseudo=false